MNEAMDRIKQELEECGLHTYLLEGVGDEIIAFRYEVPTGRYRGETCGRWVKSTGGELP